MKKAVIYYSLSGNTKEAAERIAKEAGADLFAIEPVKPMPKATVLQLIVGGGQTTFGKKPEITGVPADIASYDDIIIGLPIWAGKAAAPINTLIANYGIAEKISAVFTFSGGGDNGRCIKALSKVLPNLKNNVALADKNTKTAAGNEEKIKSFIQNI